ERDPEELLFNMGRRSSRSGRVSWKFLVCSERLWARPVLEGAWLCVGHDVSHSENMEIAHGKGIVLLPFRFEIWWKNSKSGMGISNLLDFLGWFERTQWVGSLSRICRRPSLSETPSPRRAGAGADKPCSLAQPD